MSNSFNGHALVYTVGDNCTVAIGGYAKVFLDTLPIAHRAKFDEHVGVNGKTCAFVHTNEHFEITISFRPSATTAQDDAEEQFTPIPKGSKVVLSGFKPLKYSNYTSGSPAVTVDLLNDPVGWITVGDATLTRNASEPATIDLVLRHHLDGQAALTTLVPATA